jgi:hypothetical protein
MKRKKVIWLSIAISVLLTGSVAYAFVTSKSQHAVFHGPDLISTDIERRLFADVEQALHSKLCTYVRGQDGRLADPSFKQGGRTWKSGSPPRPTMARTTTEFTGRGGHSVRIESVWVPNAPAWHFIDYNGPGGPLVITNELLALLKEQGVAVRLK